MAASDLNMPKQRITFETVRRIGLAMRDVERSTAYGSPALKVHGKLLACIAVHKSSEPNSLAVRIAFEDRSVLMKTDPDVYYLTPHYVDYPVILARLSRLDVDQLKDLLAMAYRFVTSAGVPRRAQQSKKADRSA
jgi:hypothetical protein